MLILSGSFLHLIFNRTLFLFIVFYIKYCYCPNSISPFKLYLLSQRPLLQELLCINEIATLHFIPAKQIGIKHIFTTIFCHICCFSAKNEALRRKNKDNCFSELAL